MERKKIGIVTFHRANNYGAVLQNYALITAVKQISPNAKLNTLDYRSPSIENPYKKNPFDVKTKSIFKRSYFIIRKTLVYRKWIRLCNGFETFRDKFLEMSESYSKDDLCVNEPDYDIYITGSDQVWNSRITSNDEIFALSFVKRAKKISYAASSGAVDCLDDSILQYIRSFDSISVREQDLRDYLEKRTNRNISISVDPVFLLNREDWENIMSTESVLKKPYIFTYSVSEKTDEVIKIAKNLSEKYHLDIAYLDHSIKYGSRGKKVYGSDPCEFLRLIHDAEYIVASSFHAVAFSIIFNKKFIVVPNEKTSSRIDRLLELIGLECNKVSDYKEFLHVKEKLESYHFSRTKLEQQIKESKKYLVDVLKS